METIWHFVHEKLTRTEKVVLIAVIDVAGSSPGKRGFKMAVSSGGQTYGTIGGGPMEYSMVKLAMQCFTEKRQNAFLKKQVHSSDAGEDASGLICTGEQTHAFVPLSAEQLPVIASLIRNQAEGIECIMELSPDGIRVIAGEPLSGKTKTTIVNDMQWLYMEEITPATTLYIFGGGHLSVPLSQVCSMLGFRVVVLDDRENLPTFESNNYAHRKECIQYSDAASVIANPGASCVCIMTVSHASDQLILEQLLRLPLKYLGMIGSRNKVRTIFDNLRNKGADQNALDQVYSPMGVEIHSETPEEIAVSIAAQLIQVKNAK